jgi:hypothetical protein
VERLDLEPLDRTRHHASHSAERSHATLESAPPRLSFPAFSSPISSSPETLVESHPLHSTFLRMELTLLISLLALIIWLVATDSSSTRSKD